MRLAVPLLVLFALVGCGPPSGSTTSRTDQPGLPDDRLTEDQARMKAMALCSAGKALGVKTAAPLNDIADLMPYMERGEKDILDPWGQKYQFEYVEVQPGHERLVVFTTHPTTGRRFGYPRELAEK